MSTMKWDQLLDAFETRKRGGTQNPEITDVVYDSRNVHSGCIYVAIPGFCSDGDQYIPDAIAKGAVAIVSRNAHPACGVSWAQVDDPRATLGIIAKYLWYRELVGVRNIGITGTNGKTTVAYLIHALLQFNNAHSAWLFSTVEYITGNRHIAAARTTPESADIFRRIANASEKPDNLVMEVSSHALQLRRVEGMKYQAGVWTNLTHEHLDFHSSMEAYYQAKKTLFTRYLTEKGIAIVNTDDEWGARLCHEMPGMKCITYGYGEKACVRIRSVRCTIDDTDINLEIRGEKVHLRTTLLGRFNAYNIAAVYAAGYALGIDSRITTDCLSQAQGAPGRMELVGAHERFSVVIDYAHTPDALDNVLATLAPITPERLICVFGCGGDRDRTKRPQMAQIAARWCDEAVVTSDNPRSEDPNAIIKEIGEGMPLDFTYVIEPDRETAIKKTIEGAREGDCILIAGKGHETYQEINGVRNHFSDKEVAQNALQICERAVS